MPDDTPLLQATAYAKNIHHKLIFELSEELDFLRSKYGLESFAYQKTAKRLQRMQELFKQYDRIFEGYLYHSTQLEINAKLYKKLYQNVSKNSKGEHTTATNAEAQNSTKTEANTTTKRGGRKRTARPLKIGSIRR